jgi:hypothetical protein
MKKNPPFDRLRIKDFASFSALILSLSKGERNKSRVSTRPGQGERVHAGIYSAREGYTLHPERDSAS